MVNAWYTALTFNRVWEYDRDIQRIHEAFLILAATCLSWPSPREFLDVLPRIEQKALPQKPIPANPDKVAKIIAKVNADLRIPPPISRKAKSEKIETTGVEESLQVDCSGSGT